MYLYDKGGLYNAIYVQYNLVNTNTVNTNFRIIRTKFIQNQVPTSYYVFSIDITSASTKSDKANKF